MVKTIIIHLDDKKFERINKIKRRRQWTWEETIMQIPRILGK